MKKFLFTIALASCSFLALSQVPYAGNTAPRNGQPTLSNEAVRMALLSMWRSLGHSGNYNDFLVWLKGAKGEPGVQGVAGIQGIQGTKGDKGDAGLQGSQGVQGLKGDKGDKGDAGVQGIQGIQGVKGDTGATGAAGSNGSNGSAGSTGATGAKGDKGDKGDTGAQGIQGIQGLPGVVKVAGGSTTLSAITNVLAGANYSVNITFTAPLTSTNYVLAVTINGTVTLLSNVAYAGVTNKTLTGCTVLLKNNALIPVNIQALTVEVIAFQTN